ncbi:MAG: Holliday junction resolvase RuvX [candidate division Zixibacteria bacterium]
MDRTFLGIDYGARRVGLAKSDPTGLIASALTTLEVRSDKEAAEKIWQQIEKYCPNGLVVGYPLRADGSKSEKCLEIDKFVDLLKTNYDGPVHLEDERHSSEEAADIIHAHRQRVGKDKGRLDRLAAVIILQRFLDELTD